MFVTMGQKNNAAGWNPIGSAWALLNSYEYYLYTEDREFLERLYPSMKEVANFWNEALYWSEYQKRYVSAPSYSPENGPITKDREFLERLYPSMKEVANFWNEALYWSEYQKRYVSAPSYSPENGPITNGASYDQQFIWQHFENTIQAAQILGVDEEFVLKWREKQAKLNPVLVGADGQVKEWFEETHIGKAQAGSLPEINIPQWRQSLGAESNGQQPPHRHLSHLMIKSCACWGRRTGKRMV